MIMGVYISRLIVPSSTELTVHDYAPIWAQNAHFSDEETEAPRAWNTRRSQTIPRGLVYASLSLALLALCVSGGARALSIKFGIKSLVALAWSGTDAQKEWAAGALGRNDAREVARAGGIEPLVKLARSGTDGQKEQAAGALGNLGPSVLRAGGFEVLVKLAWSGTDGQKKQAAEALEHLVPDKGNNFGDAKLAIARAGGFEVLVKVANSTVREVGRMKLPVWSGEGYTMCSMCRSNPDWAKQWAAGALRILARDDDNKVAIARAGGIEPLVKLAWSGTGEQKGQAAGALYEFCRKRTIRPLWYNEQDWHVVLRLGCLWAEKYRRRDGILGLGCDDRDSDEEECRRIGWWW